MKDRSLPSILLALQAIIFWSVCDAGAQTIGIGAGLAIPGDAIAQVTSDLAARGWSGATENASTGYYVEVRGRFGGQLALIGSIGYNRFPEATSEYFDEGNRSVQLVTAQSLVPVGIGADMRLSDGFLVPYLTLEATFNHYYRTFERPAGDFSVPFEIESSGESRIGAAVGAGLTVDAKLAEIAVGARLHLPNLLNKEEGEDEIYYAQLGATVFFSW